MKASVGEQAVMTGFDGPTKDPASHSPVSKANQDEVSGSIVEPGEAFAASNAAASNDQKTKSNTCRICSYKAYSSGSHTKALDK